MDALEWFDECDSLHLGDKGIKTDADERITIWVGPVSVTESGGLALALDRVMEAYQVWARDQRRLEDAVIDGILAERKSAHVGTEPRR